MPRASAGRPLFAGEIERRLIAGKIRQAVDGLSAPACDGHDLANLEHAVGARTRTSMGLKSGTGNVRRFSPATSTWPLGPRSVTIQNWRFASGSCELRTRARSLPSEPSRIPRSLASELAALYFAPRPAVSGAR